MTLLILFVVLHHSDAAWHFYVIGACCWGAHLLWHDFWAFMADRR